MKTTCFLQVEPDFYRHGGNNLRSLTVSRVTQKRPTKPLSGCVVLKLNLDIADAAFLPLQPEADIVIPADYVQVVAVETEPLEVPT